MKNKKSAGIGPSKYCNYSLFTLFERSVLAIFFFKNNLYFYWFWLVVVFFDPRLSKIDRTRFFAVVLHLNNFAIKKYLLNTNT